MPKNETPHHEEANRQSIEPEFTALLVRQPSKAPASDPPFGRGIKSKAKSKARIGGTSHLETTAKSCKPSKHGKQTLENVSQHVY